MSKFFKPLVLCAMRSFSPGKVHSSRAKNRRATTENGNAKIDKIWVLHKLFLADDDCIFVSGLDKIDVAAERATHRP